MAARPLADVVEAGWATALEPVAGQITAMGDFLRAEIAAGRGYLPAGDQVLRAFTRPMADVRVLVVGQDPYPTPGHPVGLSFSVAADVSPLPASLRNIYTELQTDLGIAPAPNGDLTGWFEQGVLLLNRCLTVQPGNNVALGTGSSAGAGILTVNTNATRICGVGIASQMSSSQPSALAVSSNIFSSRLMLTSASIRSSATRHSSVCWRSEEPGIGRRESIVPMKFT